MAQTALALSVIPGLFAVCRLAPPASLPTWARGDFLSITATPDELSVVCPQDNVPDNIRCEKGWHCLKVDGPLDFALTGILASLAVPLAEAGISLFALSTFDTDYILVKELQRAESALLQAGHKVNGNFRW